MTATDPLNFPTSKGILIDKECPLYREIVSIKTSAERLCAVSLVKDRRYVIRQALSNALVRRLVPFLDGSNRNILFSADQVRFLFEKCNRATLAAALSNQEMYYSTLSGHISPFLDSLSDEEVKKRIFRRMLVVLTRADNNIADAAYKLLEPGITPKEQRDVNFYRWLKLQAIKLPEPARQYLLCSMTPDSSFKNRVEYNY